MQQRHIIYLVAGIVIGGVGVYCFMRPRPQQWMGKGDKGVEVKALQRTINAAAGKSVVQEDSLWSRDLQAAVDEWLADTDIYKNGTVDKQFLQTLSKIYY